MNDNEQSNADSNRSNHMWSKTKDEKLEKCLLQLSNIGTGNADNGTFIHDFSFK